MHVNYIIDSRIQAATGIKYILAVSIIRYLNKFITVGAGSAWGWCSIAAIWVIGGLSVITGPGAGRPCHLWVACDFMDAGLTDGGAHVWGWQVAMSERGVNDHSLGNLLLTSCSHRWSGSGGEA